MVPAAVRLAVSGLRAAGRGLDFDIESNEQYNSSDLALTAQALNQVRSWASANGEQFAISYTIPVLPTGLTSTGESVLTTALAHSHDDAC